MNPNFLLLQNRHFTDVNPVQCGTQACGAGYGYGPAVRDHYLLHYVVRGIGVLHAKGTQRQLRAGDVFIIRPGQTTRYIADENAPWEYIWVGFTIKEPPKALEKTVLHLPQSHTLFLQMLAAEQMQNGREMHVAGCVMQLLALMSDMDCAQKLSPQSAVQRAVTFIETEYASDVSIADLSAQLHLDRCYFSTLFKRHTGLSPRQYLTAVRMRCAKEFLTREGLSPGEVSRLTGFPDLSSFSRAFKRTYHCSPTQLAAKR